jgi:hypothetical protein
VTAAVGNLVSWGYIVGLDLGQSRDFTTVVVNEMHEQTGVWPPIVHHRITFMHRFPLSTPYPSVVESVRKIVAQLPKRQQRPELIVDSTGVGKPVVDIMREGDNTLRPIAVTITGGSDVVEREPDDWRVPKKTLASLMQVVLQTGRIRIAQSLQLTETLVRELQAFRAKINVNGNASFESWREQDHDDLVLAAALSVWGAETRRTRPLQYGEDMDWVGTGNEVANAFMLRD